MYFISYALLIYRVRARVFIVAYKDLVSSGLEYTYLYINKINIRFDYAPFRVASNWSRSELKVIH